MKATIHALHVSPGGVPKRPVPAAELSVLGLAGDWQTDRVHHGGPDRALCLWSLEVIEVLAAAGHPVIGDSADCCDPHSKSACLWVCDVHIERSDSSSGVSVPGALPPARFDRLFEREEQVADQAARGVLKPEYLRSLLKLRPCT